MHSAGEHHHQVPHRMSPDDFLVVLQKSGVTLAFVWFNPIYARRRESFRLGFAGVI